MSEPVYLNTLAIDNLGPFEKTGMEFGPGVSVIGGAHAAGKTTAVEAIKLFFSGGADYSAIRHGQTHAAAFISWSDGMQATKTMDLATEVGKRDEYAVEVKGPSGEIKKRYAEALADRVPKGSFSATDFERLDATKRADFLIDHLHVSFSEEEFNAALNAQVGKIPNSEIVFQPVTGFVTLQRFDEIRETVYDGRKQLNVAQRDAEGAIASLRETLPKDAPIEGATWTERANDLQRQLADKETEIQKTRGEIQLEAEKARGAERERVGRQIRQQDQEIASYISSVEVFLTSIRLHSKEELELPPEFDDFGNRLEHFLNGVEVRRGLRSGLEQYIAAADKAEAEAIAGDTATLQSEVNQLSQDFGVAKANAEQEQRASGTRKAIADREASLEGLNTKAMRRTAILDALDKMKHARLADLPIEGLSIEFEKKKPIITVHDTPIEKKKPIITVHDTPIEKLSGQEALFFAIECLAFAAGQYPLILDEGDGLSAEYIQKLHDRCMAASPQRQVILARHCEGGPIRVVRYGLGERI